MGYGKIQKNNDQKAVRKDAFIKLGLGLVALLLIVDTVQISRFGAIVERVDEYNKGVVDEIGGFRQDVSLMGSDLNEMRQFLLMPTREYSFMETAQIEETDSAQQLSGTEKAAYSFLTSYISEKQMRENSQLAQSRMNSLIGNQELVSTLSEQGLTVDISVTDNKETYTFKIGDHENGPLAAIICDKSTNKLSAQSILGTEDINIDDDATAVKNYISKNKDVIIQTKKKIEERKQQLLAAMQNESIAIALKEKETTLNTEPKDNTDTLDFEIQNKDGVAVFTIMLSKKDGGIAAEGNQLDSNKDLAEQLIPLIRNIDTATESEKMISERRVELENIFNEPAFADMLKNSGLTVDAEPREDYNKLIYDVKDTEGNVQFSFVIEISSGLYKVLKDNQETDFYSLLQDGSKKKS